MTFGLDALGRHATRVEAGVTETYSYAGTSPAVVAIAPATGTAVQSVVDASGARLAVTTSAGGFGWTLADLGGNLAGSVNSSGGLVTDAVRYDPWGEVVATAVRQGTPRGRPSPLHGADR